MKEWLAATHISDVGEFYDGIYDRSGGEAFIEDRDPIIDILRKNSSKAEQPRNLDLLDAGCGSGNFIEAVLSKGILSGDTICCVGIETSKRAFAVALNKLKGATIEPYAIESIPKEWFGGFDYVTSLGVLEHTMNPRACFSILMQCLKRGGMLLITVPLEFEDCLSSLRNEPNQKTNERFMAHSEWLDYFGNQEESSVVLESNHVAIIYRRK